MLSVHRASKCAILAGLALWMSIAVFNNIIDSQTNVIHLRTMLSMELIAEDPNFGNGLEHRAWSPELAAPLLNGVIALQLVIAAALWLAAGTMGAAALRPHKPALARLAPQVAIAAVTLFAGLWLFFMSGGLWFGYWMKQGAIQQVHMTLLIISLGTLLYMAQPDPSPAGRE